MISIFSISLNNSCSGLNLDLNDLNRMGKSVGITLPVYPMRGSLYTAPIKVKLGQQSLMSLHHVRKTSIYRRIIWTISPAPWYQPFTELWSAEWIQESLEQAQRSKPWDMIMGKTCACFEFPFLSFLTCSMEAILGPVFQLDKSLKTKP